MVDTTPLNQNPRDDEPAVGKSPAVTPEKETPSTVPHPAAAGPYVPQPGADAPARTAAGSPRPKRGLLLTGGIVAAVVVLGGTFGGGLLVGSSLHSDFGRGGMIHGPARDGMRPGFGHGEGAGRGVTPPSGVNPGGRPPAEGAPGAMNG